MDGPIGGCVSALACYLVVLGFLALGVAVEVNNPAGAFIALGMIFAGSLFILGMMRARS